MVQRRQRERSLFEVLLPDGHKLWPNWLRKIDTLLEDDAVIEVVAQALEKRCPQSRRRGRLGTPAEVVIRMLILKHLFDWSSNEMEREVRANLVYRMFTRIDAGGRLTGKVGPYSIGLLNVQTDEEPVSGARATNFSVVRVKRDVLRRSNIGVLMTRRSVSTVGDGSNDVFGVDGSLVTANCHFTATALPWQWPC